MRYGTKTYTLLCTISLIAVLITAFLLVPGESKRTDAATSNLSLTFMGMAWSPEFPEQTSFNYSMHIKDVSNNIVFSTDVSSDIDKEFTLGLNDGETYVIDIYGPLGTGFLVTTATTKFITRHLEFVFDNNYRSLAISFKLHDPSWFGKVDIL